MKKYRYKFANIDGKTPMIDFLNELEDEEVAKIYLYMNKLVEYKNNELTIPQNISKYIEDGIYELRVSHMEKISRYFYFYENGKEIIFTNGFIKKTQKTPKREIELAKKIKKETHK